MNWKTAATLCFLVALPASVGAQSGFPGVPPATTAPQLVIPFENQQRESRLYWLGEASAVLVTDAFRSLGVSAITREDRLRAFERLRVPPVATLSHATIIRIGQVVRAGQVVLGTFTVQGIRLTVRARAIKLDTGRLSPEVVESGELNDIFGIYARVARRLAPDGSQLAALATEQPPPLAAFEQYIRGVLAENPAMQVTFLTQAVRLAPDFQRARLALWGAYTEQSEHQHAYDAVSGVSPGDPVSRRARFLAGVSLLQLGRYQEAFDAFNALNMAKADPALLNNLGAVQLRRPADAPGGKAALYFNEAAKTDGSDSDYFFNLGYAYWIDRDSRAAVYWLREAVRRNPADHEAHYVLGVALQAGGNGAEAAREKELAHRLSSIYTEWEASQPRTDPIPRGLERLKTDIDLSESRRVDDVLVEEGKRDQQELAAFYLDRGRRQFQAEHDAEAIADLRRAVYLAPYQGQAHLLLGRLYLRNGRIQEAVEALKIAIWTDDRPESRITLADAYTQLKNIAAARAELQDVLARDPANTEARRMLDDLK